MICFHLSIIKTRKAIAKKSFILVFLTIIGLNGANIEASASRVAQADLQQKLYPEFARLINTIKDKINVVHAINKPAATRLENAFNQLCAGVKTLTPAELAAELKDLEAKLVEFEELKKRVTAQPSADTTRDLKSASCFDAFNIPITKESELENGITMSLQLLAQYKKESEERKQAIAREQRLLAYNAGLIKIIQQNPELYRKFELFSANI